MSTIANAKVEHNYNRYNGYFFGCLRNRRMYMFNCNILIKHNIDYITFLIKQYINYNNTINYLFTKYKAKKKIQVRRPGFFKYLYE